MMSDLVTAGIKTTTDVTVSDAQHHGEGRSKYTSYLVEVRSSSNPSVCRRRYSDFQWLYRRLLTDRAGAIIPILPHRKALTPKFRFSEELVNERQTQLQVFLRRIMNHPELNDAPCLFTFFTADYAVWEAAKKDADGQSTTQGDEEAEDDLTSQKRDGGASPAGSGRRLTNMIGNLVGKAKAKIAIAGGMEMEQTPDDAIFEEFDAYVAQLDSNVKILAKETAILVSATKTKASNLEHMGAAFSAMGQYRTGDAVVKTSSAELFTKLSEHFIAFARLSSNLHQEEKTLVDDPMQTMSRDVQSLKYAMQQRKECLYEYTRKASQGKNKMNQLDKLKDMPGASPDKMNQIETELGVLKEEGIQLWKEVDTVSKRLQRDMERFRFQFHEQMRSAMESYTRVQLVSCQLELEEWTSMKPDVAPPPGTQPSPPSKEEDAAVTTLL